MIRVEDLNNQNTVILNPTTFPDGTNLIKYNPTYAGAYRITWLYDNDGELFELISLTKHLKNCGCEVHLRMPYVPNARMDRVKSDDEVFTLKYFADTINWLGFDSITICNPHSTVSEALFNKCRSDFNIVKCDIQKILTNDPTIEAIYYPDAGAMKRYADLLKDINLPIAYGEKKRDWKTGEILGIDIIGAENIIGKNVLMIDDICAYGGTFYYSALKMKEIGVKDISCYVTHLENSVLDEEKGKLIKGELIKKIYSTNSIFRGKHDKIELVTEF